MCVRIQGLTLPSGKTIAFTAEPGEIVLIKGTNGSGKTSLLRLLAGLPTPLRLHKAILGGNVPVGAPAAVVADTVGFAMQNPRDTLVGLTVEGEYRMRGGKPPVYLSSLKDRDVGHLSSGEARQVSLDIATSKARRLILLDEPAEGLDARARWRLREGIAAAARAGSIVLVTDHVGVMHDLATKSVDLDDAPTEVSGSVPRPKPGPHLRATSTIAKRDSAKLELPDIDLAPGFHVIIGPNGSGKSTLLHRLAGTLPTKSPPTIEERPLRAGTDVRMSLANAFDCFSRDSVAEELAGVEADVRKLLVPVALLKRHPLNISGGEAQRVSLAKTLGRPAKVYLLDEPEAHLDHSGRSALIKIIARIATGCIVVAATHQPEFEKLAHSAIRLRGHV